MDINRVKERIFNQTIMKTNQEILRDVNGGEGCCNACGFNYEALLECLKVKDQQHKEEMKNLMGVNLEDECKICGGTLHRPNPCEE